MKKTLIINYQKYFAFTDEYKLYANVVDKHEQDWRNKSQTCIDLHSIVQSTVGERSYYQTYQKEFNRILWWQLFQNHLSHVFVVIRNVYSNLDNAISIARHCYFNGITCYICVIEDACRLVRSLPPHTADGKIITLCQSGEKPTDYTSWNQQDKYIREQLMSNHCDRLTAIEYQQLDYHTQQLAKAIGLQFPDDYIMECEVRLNAKVYDVDYDIHYFKYENKPRFYNEGSLANANWKCTAQNSEQQVIDVRSQKPASVSEHLELCRAYAMIMYYKLTGITPDESQNMQCPVCGQWHSITSEHCPVCDTTNAKFVDITQRDFLYESSDIQN